jgi:hypothetical protein
VAVLDSVKNVTEHEPARDGGHAPDHVQEPLPIAMSGEPDRIIEGIGGGTDAPPFPVALMAVAALPGVGYRTLYGLVTSYGADLGALLAAPPRVTAAHLRQRKAPKALIEAFEDLPTDLVSNAHKRLERLGQNVHMLGPEELPKQLLQLPGGPRWLFVQGGPRALGGGPHVAVVGTREASPAGVEAVGVVVRTLAAYPVTLISGLANGIDAAAHARALEFKVRNVAFLGHGINLVFPAETRQLRERIIEDGGAIATEYLPDERYRKQQFGPPPMYAHPTGRAPSDSGLVGSHAIACPIRPRCPWHAGSPATGRQL